MENSLQNTNNNFVQFSYFIQQLRSSLALSLEINLNEVEVGLCKEKGKGFYIKIKLSKPQKLSETEITKLVSKEITCHSANMYNPQQVINCKWEVTLDFAYLDIVKQQTQANISALTASDIQEFQNYSLQSINDLKEADQIEQSRSNINPSNTSEHVEKLEKINDLLKRSIQNMKNSNQKFGIDVYVPPEELCSTVITPQMPTAYANPDPNPLFEPPYKCITNYRKAHRKPLTQQGLSRLGISKKPQTPLIKVKGSTSNIKLDSAILSAVTKPQVETTAAVEEIAVVQPKKKSKKSSNLMKIR